MDEIIDSMQMTFIKLWEMREETWFNPWVETIPWRRKWQPTPVYLPGKYHGQRSLVATVHGVKKESDMTE